jgi:hypothetical protein
MRAGVNKRTAQRMMATAEMGRGQKRDGDAFAADTSGSRGDGRKPAALPVATVSGSHRHRREIQQSFFHTSKNKRCSSEALRKEGGEVNFLELWGARTAQGSFTDFFSDTGRFN